MIPIESIVAMQRAFFQTGETKTCFFRSYMLEKMAKAIKEFQPRIIEALQSDLGKSETETILTEIWPVLSEIRYHKKHLGKWMKKKRVQTPLVLRPGKSYQLASPLGVSLIISPWNYPFHLALMPLVGAISAGNTAVIKPSESSPATSALIKELCESIFEEKYVSVYLGDRKHAEELLEQDFDHIFFTGSPSVGALVHEKGAKHHAKITLELGGKSPVILDNTARLDKVIQRLVFGKTINAGQTCVAPDYLICHEKMFEPTIKAIQYYLKEMYGDNILENPDYTRIINERHFARLTNLLVDAEILIGGASNANTLRIEPTVVRIRDLNDPFMQEEIFGPILPIITYRDEKEIDTIIQMHPNPLAFYVFSENPYFCERVLYKHSFGTGAINDTISQLIPHKLPFGGVKTSGLGNYHGYASFLCFSHLKSIYDKGKHRELKVKYPPYNEKVKKLIRKFFTK